MTLGNENVLRLYVSKNHISAHVCLCNRPTQLDSFHDRSTFSPPEPRQRGMKNGCCKPARALPGRRRSELLRLLSSPVTERERSFSRFSSVFSTSDFHTTAKVVNQSQSIEREKIITGGRLPALGKSLDEPRRHWHFAGVCIVVCKSIPRRL